MYDNELAYQIIKVIKKNSEGLSDNDLSKLLRIKKHKYKDLIQTLKNLTKENKLNFQNKKYCILEHKKRKIGRSIKSIIGIFDATSLVKNNSFAFVITDNGDIFISSEDTLNSFHGDKVVVEIYRSNARMTMEELLKYWREKGISLLETYIFIMAKPI